MYLRADEVLRDAFLHIPVEHFEAIEEIKQQLNIQRMSIDWIYVLAGVGMYYLVGKIYDIVEAIIKNKKS